MITRLTITEFIALAASHPVLDVRSPGEYVHAHIVKAYNLPLFTDEERKVVGTAYKQQGKQEAIKIGLAYFGCKMVPMIDAVTAICQQFCGDNRAEKTLLVHCWRGGMRSAGIAWLLDLYGFKVYTLVGGYKAYRNWVLEQFTKNYNLQILGGYTGSGKSELLKELQLAGETVIDLENLAAHKGSAFGAIGMPAQPTQEMFENMLAELLHKNASDTNKMIWLEDESRRIGKMMIPLAFFSTMREKPVVFLSIPFGERLKFIVATYGTLNKQELLDAIERIKKRLGGLETKNAVNFLQENDLHSCFHILLAYYDKYYLKGLHNRDNITTQIKTIEAVSVDAVANAAMVLKLNYNHD